MDNNQFYEDFLDALDVDVPSEVSWETDYHDLDGWSSMSGMRLIAMIEDKYGVLLSSTDIRHCDSIINLFELIKMKKNG